MTATLRIPMTARLGSHHVRLFVGQQKQKQKQQFGNNNNHADPTAARIMTTSTAPPVPQVQTLIVDTGSRLTAFPCRGCSQCGLHVAEQYYDPDQSTTVEAVPCGSCQWQQQQQQQDTSSSSASSYQKQQRRLGSTLHCADTLTTRGGIVPVPRQYKDKCLFEQRYTEGSSWQAYEVSEMVALALALDDDDDDDKQGQDYEASLPWTVPFVFGCQYQVQGLFVQQYADGILGLERSQHSLVEAMFRYGMIPSPTFSLCMTLSGGSLGMGGAHTDWHWYNNEVAPPPPPPQKKTTNSNMMLWTPQVATPASGLYAVRVEQVWLGTICVACPGSAAITAFATGKGTILDSGTTDTFLPAALASAFDAAWMQQTGKWLERQRTATYTWQELLELPSITFVLANNVTWEVPALHYMEGALAWQAAGGAAGTSRPLTNRVYVDEPKGATLGINMMLHHDIYFSKDWIGIARADCQTPSSMA